MTWVQQGCNWVYTAADGSPLGTLEHLGQLWRLSVLQNGCPKCLEALRLAAWASEKSLKK